MIAKFIDGVFTSLGNGNLSDIHISNGYSEINESMLAKDLDGNFYSYYLATPDINGIYQANTAKTAEQLQEEAIAHYKSLYMGLVSDKLKELDYDSLATVKLWEGDATFGAEATKILNWYKGIIQRNYELLNAGFPMTDEEYLVALSVVVF